MEATYYPKASRSGGDKEEAAAMSFISVLADLATDWRLLAAESAILDHNQRLDISRDGKTHEQVAHEIIAAGRPGWVQGWRPGWWTWGICIEDSFPIDCGLPVVTSRLSATSGIKVAALSLFEPGCVLPIHTHPELAGECWTYHLGLSVPKHGCALWTEDRFHLERNGHSFVFDGSRPHYAFNCSDRERVVLYVEFRR